MNRTRLSTEFRYIGHEMQKRLYDSMGYWYKFKVYTQDNHLADRTIDRSNSVKNNLKVAKEILLSACTHYGSNLLKYAVESFESGSNQNRVMLYRKVDGQNFVVAITIRMVKNDEQSKPLITVSVRTVMPAYNHNLKEVNSIHVNFKPPKINFVYDGFRRVLSPLDRLISSKDCPPALHMMKNI